MEIFNCDVISHYFIFFFLYFFVVALYSRRISFFQNEIRKKISHHTLKLEATYKWEAARQNRLKLGKTKKINSKYPKSVKSHQTTQKEK